MGTVQRQQLGAACQKGPGSESPPGKGKGKRKQQRGEVASATGGKGKANLRVAGAVGASAGHLFLEERIARLSLGTSPFLRCLYQVSAFQTHTAPFKYLISTSEKVALDYP